MNYKKYLLLVTLFVGNGFLTAGWERVKPVTVYDDYLHPKLRKAIALSVVGFGSWPFVYLGIVASGGGGPLYNNPIPQVSEESLVIPAFEMITFLGGMLVVREFDLASEDED